ncbi:MAG: VWA domain-containing protein [Pirellulales bacterium]|nr:VWA domain-containing protein [Pirellulales bacterium]
MNGNLPTWIQRLLGIDSPPGEGASWSLEHTWPWPPWVSVLAVAAIVVFVVFIYSRENRRAHWFVRGFLATIRLSLVAIVLLMIAQFMLALQRTGLPYVAVLVDDSLSMGVVDRYDEPLQGDLRRRLEKAELEKGARHHLPERPEGGFAQMVPGTFFEPEGTLSRENLAKMILLEKDARLLHRVAEDYKLRVYFLTGLRTGETTVDKKLFDQIRTSQPTGSASRLGEAVQRILDDLRGSAPAALILLTDGVNTAGPGLDEAAALARRRGVPLLVVGLGDPRPVRDLKLTDLLVDEVVFVDDVVPFEAKLTGTGLEGQEVRVVLRREGTSEVLAETKVKVGPDGQARPVRLSYRPREVGSFRFTLEAEPLDGELDTDNNRQQRSVEVRKEQIRVLLVQDYPNFEFRYLRNMLARDASIKLNTLLQDADVGHAEQDAAALSVFPVRRDELFAYDVVILGDVDPKRLNLSTMQLLADFVQRPGKGGALILIAGPRFMPKNFAGTPLEPLMPVMLDTVRLPDAGRPITQGFTVRPTPLGLQAPPMQLGDSPAQTEALWRKLAPLYWMIDAPELKRAARVWAVNPDRLGSDGRPLPVIVMQYTGAGRVLMHMTDETWRWRFRVGDVYFARYWVQAIRYLSRAKLADENATAALTTQRREYAQGEPVRLRLRFADPRQAPSEDDGVTVVVQQRDRQHRNVQLTRTDRQGVFEGELTGLTVGEYHVWVVAPAMDGQAPSVDFRVTAPPGELQHVEMAADTLRRIAQATKGHYYTVETSDDLLGDLPAGHQVPVETLPPKPLWNQWPLLALFLVLLTVEWTVRKWKGMV